MSFSKVAAKRDEMSLYPLSKNCQTLSQGEESRDWTGVVVSKTQNTRY